MNSADARPVFTRNRVLLMLLALGLVALLGYWFASLTDQRGMAPPVAKTGEPAPPSKASAAEPNGQPAARNTAQPASSAVGEEPLTPEAQEATDDDPDLRTMQVECRTLDGDPVPHVRMSCWVQSPIPSGPMEEWDIGSMVQENRILETDEDGNFEVTAHKSYRITIKPADGDWVPVSSTLIETTFSRNGPLRIVLREAYRGVLRVRIQYDDGVPFQGRAMVEEADDGPHVHVSFNCDQEGRAIVKPIPTDRRLRTRNYETRAGYIGRDQHWTYIEPEELRSDQELPIIIPRHDKPVSIIRVVFVGDRPPHGTHVVVEAERRTPQRTRVPPNRPEWTSGALDGTDGKHRVIILGPMAWQSDWLTLTAGEETVVHAQLRLSNTVRARLVDASGTPLPNGGMRLTEGSYMQFGGKYPRSDDDGPPPVLQRRSVAVANEEGVVTLSGLPHGSLTVEAGAWGKMTVTRVVDARDSSTTDLGDIVLMDAAGEVTIHLTAMRPDIEYAVVLFQPAPGPPLRPFQPVSGNSVIVTGLDLREYTVGITTIRGGRIVSERVSLSTEQPFATITLDVSPIEAPGESR